MSRFISSRREIAEIAIVSGADLAWDALFNALVGRGFDPTGCRAFLDSSASYEVRRAVEFRRREAWDAAAGLSRAEVETAVRHS